MIEVDRVSPHKNSMVSKRRNESLWCVLKHWNFVFFYIQSVIFLCRQFSKKSLDS